MPTKSKAKKTSDETGEARARKRSAASNDTAVKFTNPDRVYWPDAEVTKQQLADYYTAVWDHIAPHLVNRPLALLRCPDGIAGQCFFQKHAGAGLISDRVHRMKDSHGEELLSIEDLDGLLTLVQAGVLEIHVWGSTIDGCRALRPHRVRSRSGRRRAVELRSTRRRASCASASPISSSRAS